ncbi:IS66 family transposase [Muriicola sp.]|uniref:IS66 family transposase n=1 Tax=Muriicola sp. TaxID=2020856 RepID=UPI003C7345CE
MSKDEQIAELQRENAYLRQELATLKKLIFGTKSERYRSQEGDQQLHLFVDEQPEEEKEVSEKETISYDRKKGNHTGRNKLPDHLPVEEIVIEPEEDTSGLKKIGEEVTETLKYTKASLVKLKTIRPKYEKPNQEGVLIAPLPSRAMHKCIAEPSLISHILVSKFVDHLPFYRQIKMFARDFDWELSSSTINDWFVACCTLLKPIYDQMVEGVKTSNYLQVDESPIKVLESEKEKQTHQGYQWVYHSPLEKVIVFHYRKGRGMQGPKEFLSDYQGYLQCDGYKVYDRIGKVASITLVGCIAHARRYFHQALENDSSRSKYALEKFKAIYHIERKWKAPEKTITQQERKSLINTHLQELKTWCEQQVHSVLPKSAIGKAIGYYLKQYPKLKVVADQEFIEIDNNLIENKIRPLALGRKNYLFAGSHKSAQRIAMMYSFFATCKAKGKDPGLWLENTLELLADPEYPIQLLIP